MKNSVVLVLPLAAITVFTLSSYSLQDDPNGKAGVAGGPSETTCNATNCHNTFAFNFGTGYITFGLN